MLGVPENEVQPTGPTNARFTAPDLASGAQAIARGAENLGQGISAVEDTAEKLGEQYDTAAVKQADAEDLQKLADIRATALTAVGFDAQTAVQTAREQVEAVRKDRMSSLHNARQRMMYADTFAHHQAALESDFSSHLITQTKAAEKEASTARYDSYADMAVRTFGTKAFDDNLGTALREVANINAGMGDDVIKRKQAVARSAILSSAISGIIADPDHAETAQQALDQHASELIPADEEKLRRQLNPILKENQTDADAGWAFTDAAIPSTGYYPEHPAETPETPPRTQIKTPADEPAPSAPVSPADPLRGKGRITDNAAAHRARGAGNALDIAAPAGTPIYAPMSGRVIKSWWDKKGGWSVLVEHPNGYVTGYAHLRSKSPLAEGQTVEPTIPIGSVGATGDATGPHVHYTVRQSRGGPKIDPSAALWDKGSVKPESVSWKENEPQRFKAEENGGLDRALSRLHDRAVAENWSPARYNDAVARARQVAGVQEQLYNQQTEQAYNSAIETVVGLGDKFTNVSQIPGFGNLKPTQQYSLQQIAEGNRKAAAGDGVKANGDRFLMLYGMAHDPAYRQQFLGVDLGKETDVTPGERKDLFAWQQQLRLEPNGALAGNMDTANALANRYLPKAQFSPAQRQQFMDRFAAAQERQQNALGRPLNSRESDDIARALTVQVVHDGKHLGFEGTGGTVDIPSTFNRIAPDIRQDIANRLAAQGKPHSPRDVVAFWLQSRSR